VSFFSADWRKDKEGATGAACPAKG